MSIERPLKPLSVPPVNVRHQDLKMRPRTADVGPTQVAGCKNTGTQIKLSKLTQEIQTDTSHDIDYECIAKIRASMDAGELQFDPDHIANALVEDIFQLS